MGEVLRGGDPTVNRLPQKEREKRVPQPYAHLLANAIGESTPPKGGKHGRILAGWGATHALTIGGQNVKVGFNEAWYSRDHWKGLFLHPVIPAYGIRIGESDLVHRKAKHIEKKLGEH